MLCAFSLVCTKLIPQVSDRVILKKNNISRLGSHHKYFFTTIQWATTSKFNLAIFSKVQTPKFKFEGLKARFCSSYRFDDTPKWFSDTTNKIIWSYMGGKEENLIITRQ